jgi:hypothetical protein
VHPCYYLGLRIYCLLFEFTHLYTYTLFFCTLPTSLFGLMFLHSTVGSISTWLTTRYFIQGYHPPFYLNLRLHYIRRVYTSVILCFLGLHSRSLYLGLCTFTLLSDSISIWLTTRYFIQGYHPPFIWICASSALGGFYTSVILCFLGLHSWHLYLGLCTFTLLSVQSPFGWLPAILFRVTTHLFIWICASITLGGFTHPLSCTWV